MSPAANHAPNIPVNYFLTGSLVLNKPGGVESALGTVMRLFVALGIVASRDEADKPLARVMMRDR